MALQAREKKMLKVLGVVAVLSAIGLFFTYRPKKIENAESPTSLIEEIPDEETPAGERAGSTSSSPRSRGGGGNPGGGGGSSSSIELGSINLSALEQHNTPNDCWVVIGDEVYDIAGFIQNYPEQSNSASQYCGTVGFEVGFLAEGADLKGSIKQVSSLVGKF
jgi:hypothetical protein